MHLGGGYLKECKHPHCHRLIKSGAYCDKHTQDTNSYYNRQRRRHKENRFYASAEWKGVRQQALKRDCFVCAGCGGVADTVHHLVEVRVDWSKRLDIDNLQSVCRSCHNKIEHYRK